MEEDNTVAQWSAKLSSDDKAAMEAPRNPPDLGAADPASGPLGDPPAGTAATGSEQTRAKELSHTSTAMWGEEHSPSTPANPASGPLGDPLAGEAGEMGEPPPPLPPGSPRLLKETEAIGAEELNVGRSDVKDPNAGLNEDDKKVLTHAAEAEWVLYLRSSLQALCLLEDLDDVAALSRDPPCATAEIYMDLLI